LAEKKSKIKKESKNQSIEKIYMFDINQQYSTTEMSQMVDRPLRRGVWDGIIVAQLCSFKWL
jgi:hypothetical protein